MRAKGSLGLLVLLSTAWAGDAPKNPPKNENAEEIEASDPLLWEATKGPTRIYVLGTVPANHPRLLVLPPQVAEAFQRAEALYTEQTLDVEEIRQEVWRRAKKEAKRHPIQKAPPKSLKETIPEPLFIRLRKVVPAPIRPLLGILTEHDIGSALDYVRSSDRLVLAQKHEAVALSRHLYTRAKAAGKGVAGLSRLDEHGGRTTSLLEALGHAERIELLESHVDHVERHRAAGTPTAQRLIELYLAGDAGGIAKLVREPWKKVPKAETAFAEDWAKVLGRRLVDIAKEKPKRVLFVVLETHLVVGPKGITRLLEGTGFKVRRIRAKDKLAPNPG